MLSGENRRNKSYLNPSQIQIHSFSVVLIQERAHLFQIFSPNIQNSYCIYDVHTIQATLQLFYLNQLVQISTLLNQILYFNHAY